MKIAFGCDHGGFALKQEIFGHLKERGMEVVDFGAFDGRSSDYADYAVPVCQCVLDGGADLGVLVCGTGIGMSMAANKIRSIRCAHVQDTFSARATREHNDANVIALGARVLGAGLMLEILDAFLDADFSREERHQRRIDKVMALDGHR